VPIMPSPMKPIRCGCVMFVPFDFYVLVNGVEAASAIPA